MAKTKSLVLCSCMILFAGLAWAQEVDPFEELASLAATVAKNSVSGGGSIRAKRELDPELTKRLNDPRACQGRIEEKQLSEPFPQTIIKLRVRKLPAEGIAKDVKAGDLIVAIPKYKYNERRELLTQHQDNKYLLQSPYVKTGDMVAIRLIEKRDNVWVFDYIERL